MVAFSVSQHLKTTCRVMSQRPQPAKAERNPVRGVKLLKENNERVRVLTDAEEGCLMAVLPPYLQPLVVVALHTGMRWGELAKLEWRDLDFNTRSVAVTEAKSGEGRHIPMNQVVLTPIGE